MKDFCIEFRVSKFRIIVLWLICPTRRIVAHQGRKTFRNKTSRWNNEGEERDKQGMKNSCHSQAKLYHWHQRCRTSLSCKHFFIAVTEIALGITNLWYHFSTFQNMLSILWQQHKWMIIRKAKTIRLEMFCNSLCSIFSCGSMWDFDRLRHKWNKVKVGSRYGLWKEGVCKIHRQKIVKGFDKANLCLSFGPLKVFLAFFLSPKGSHCERREGWEQVELQKLSLLFVLANRIIGSCCWHEIESMFWKEEKW